MIKKTIQRTVTTKEITKNNIDAVWDSILQKNVEKYGEALEALSKGPGEEVHFSDSKKN